MATAIRTARTILSRSPDVQSRASRGTVNVCRSDLIAIPDDPIRSED